MKKKIIYSVIAITLVAGIAGILYMKKYKNNSNTKKETKSSTKKEIKEKCNEFTGGSFDIIFNTNDGNKIENMKVGIAVSPDSYQDLPTPAKDDFTFDGWYYDNEFQNKVNTTNSKDIEPIPQYDDNKCKTGYKDIELFAKWIENPKENNNENKENQIVTNNSQEEQITNDNQAVEENSTEIPETDTPANVSTKLYKPTNYGNVMRGFGFTNGKFHGMKISTSYGVYLYPMNNGYFVAQANYNSNNHYGYSYFIYKTVIDNVEYYVMYYSSGTPAITRPYFIDFTKKVNEYNNSYNIVKSDEPIGVLFNNSYEIYITKIFDSNPNTIFNGMLKFNGYQVNSNELLKLSVGDVFTER